MEICLWEVLEKKRGTWDGGGVLVNLKKECDFFFFSFPWNYMHCAKMLMKRIFIANLYYCVLSSLKIFLLHMEN
jgi:hypothetical protein